jgi:hypothetical protein
MNNKSAAAAFVGTLNITEENKKNDTKSALVDEGTASSVNAIWKSIYTRQKKNSVAFSPQANYTG